MKSKERAIVKLWSLVDDSIGCGNTTLADRILELLISYIPEKYINDNLTRYIDSLRELMIFNVFNDNSLINWFICKNLVVFCKHFM